MASLLSVPTHMGVRTGRGEVGVLLDPLEGVEHVVADPQGLTSEYEIHTLAWWATNFPDTLLKNIQTVAWQCFEALAGLERNRSSHGNLHMRNITMDKNGHVAIVWDGEFLDILKETEDIPKYDAPEFFVQDNFGSTNEGDIWSLACIIYKIATGDNFCQIDSEGGQKLKRQQVKWIVKRLGTRLKDSQPGSLKALLKKKYSKSLNLNCARMGDAITESIGGMKARSGPDSRFSTCIDGAQLNDLLKRMLRIEPHKRIRAAEALRHPFFSTIKEVSFKFEFAGPQIKEIHFSDNKSPKVRLAKFLTTGLPNCVHLKEAQSYRVFLVAEEGGACFLSRILWEPGPVLRIDQEACEWEQMDRQQMEQILPKRLRRRASGIGARPTIAAERKPPTVAAEEVKYPELRRKPKKPLPKSPDCSASSRTKRRDLHRSRRPNRSKSAIPRLRLRWGSGRS